MSKNSFTSGGRLKVTAGVAAATDRRPGGWAINDAEQSQIIDLGSDAVPADATFLGGSAYKSDGSRYVTFDTPSNAQFIGGQAIRADGALHMTTSDPDVRLGQWGHTSNGAACAEAEIAVVSDGALFSDSTFTGPAGRTYFDSDGIMQTVAANVARTTYIGGNPYLWIDGAVEEISGYSNDLDNAAWDYVDNASAVKNATGLDGEDNSGWTITDNSNTTLLRRFLRTTIPDDNKTRYAVFAVGKNDSPSVYPRCDLRVFGGTTSLNQPTVLDVTNGTLTELLTEGFIALPPVLFDETYIFVLGITNNSSGNTNADLYLYPAYNADGGAGSDATLTGSNIFRYAGLFEDNFSLMPILTDSGTTKSLAAEVASLTNSIISSLTEGTIYMEVWSPQLTSNAARHIAELESDANNFLRVLHAADGDLDAQITDGGASQAALAGTDLTVGTLQKVALTFKANEFSLYRDGTQLATDAAGTVPSVDTLLIGAGLYGGIKTLNVHTTAWSQAKAESETT